MTLHLLPLALVRTLNMSLLRINDPIAHEGEVQVEQVDACHAAPSDAAAAAEL